MKTFPIIAFFAALAAFVLFPLSVEFTGSMLFAAGLLCILVGDYNRPVRPLISSRTQLTFPPAASRSRALELAA